MPSKVPYWHFCCQAQSVGTVRDMTLAWGYSTAMVTSRIRTRRGGRRLHLYIEEWMNVRGLSDERLAGRLNVARETVTRYRNEQHRLNPDKIAAIAEALDLEPTELWRPPDASNRPSIDAILRDAPTEAVEKVAELAILLAKTGS